MTSTAPLGSEISKCCRMYQRMDSGDPGDPFVKDLEVFELPSCHPDQEVVPSCKEKEERQVDESKVPSSVRNWVDCESTIMSDQQQYGVQNKVYKYQDCLSASREAEPSGRLYMVVAKECREYEVSTDPSDEKSRRPAHLWALRFGIKLQVGIVCP